MDNSANNKRIAKNTAFLYIRMLILTVITLYTQRIVLEYLGVVDFGVYNVIGGVTVTIVFFTSSFINATQRYLNIELGQKNIDNANKIVNLHLLIYLVICIATVIIAETIGRWFIITQLVIPADRMDAALWTFQFSIISICSSLLGIVFNSLVIAHEDMKVFSYLGIFEGFAKLITAFVIQYTADDKLIVYSGLLAGVVIIVQIIYAIYSFRKYIECRIKFYFNSSLLKQTFAFIGWNSLGCGVFALNDGGVNFLLNIFFGPIVNAARAVSFQVNSVINNLGSNFYTAVRPQLVKSYANGDLKYLIDLFFNSSRYSYFLLWVFTLPIILNIQDILKIWLTDVPDDCGIFTIWVLIYSLINIFTNPIWSLIMAVRKLKKYVLIGAAISVTTFPVVYLLFKLGFSPVWAFVILSIVRAVYLAAALFILAEHIKFSIKEYLKKVMAPCTVVTAMSILLSVIVTYVFPHFTLAFIALCIIEGIIILSCIYLLGLHKNERETINRIIKSKING